MKNLFQKFKKVAKLEESSQPTNTEEPEMNLPLEGFHSNDLPANDDEKNVRQLKKAISEVAVHLWRMKKKMIDENGDPIEDFRRHFRHLQAALDDLTNSQVEIKDFDDETIPESGVLSLRVLAYQPTSGIDSERVIETVKPAIYYKGETIQYGEVIVGILEDKGETV